MPKLVEQRRYLRVAHQCWCSAIFTTTGGRRGLVADHVRDRGTVPLAIASDADASNPSTSIITGTTVTEIGGSAPKSSAEQLDWLIG